MNNEPIYDPFDHPEASFEDIEQELDSVDWDKIWSNRIAKTIDDDELELIDGNELAHLPAQWRKKASKMRSRAGFRTYSLAEARGAGYEACAESLQAVLEKLGIKCQKRPGKRRQVHLES